MGILGNYLPNWLPEDPSQNAAARQGLVAFGAGLLGGRGDLGGILGDGLMAGTQTYNGALAQQQQTALRQAQLDQTKLENTKLQAAADRPRLIAEALKGPAQASQQQQAPVPAKQEFGGPRRGIPSFDSSLDGYPPRVLSLADVPKIGEPRAESTTQARESAFPSPTAANEPPDDYAALIRHSANLAAAGLAPEAKQYLDMAKDLRPEVREVVEMQFGDKRVMVQLFKDGRPPQILDGFAPKAEKLHFANTGGATVGLDSFTGKQISTVSNTQSPDSVARVAQDERESRRVDERVRAAAVPAADGMLPDETVAMMAEQYRAGDTSVMQNLGRGAQGAQNIIRLRNEIARQTREAGQGGRDLAAQNAEYFGTKAGQRSAGTRIANVEMASYEAESLIPLARDASAAVARSGLLPFGKGQVMFNEQTNDPAMRQFAAANNALVNVYSRAISPSGVPTVADKEHAREMIATAMDDKSYQAVLNQMQKEITAARQAPQQVRRAFNDAVTGKGDHGPIKDVKDLPKKAAPQTYADPAKEQRYQEWKRSQGK